MKTVLVIGGGITGMAAMYELQKWKKENKSNVKLILAEGADHLGGKIRSVKQDGFLMESGADSIVTRKTHSMSFMKDLELEEEVVYNASGKSYIYSDGQLHPIPSNSVFGIPGTIEALAESTLVSAEGKIAALKDFYTKNEHFTEEDSIGEFLEHFFGKELVEKQIAPVLSGVYSGDLNQLTISATLPSVLKYKNEFGSIIKGFEANLEMYQSSGQKRFLSFKNGLDTLIVAYTDRMEDVQLLMNSKAERIEKQDGQYKVTFTNGEEIIADHIILSIPHKAAENMLADQELQDSFQQLKSSSLISVYLGFEVRDSVLPADGTGFISADPDELTCNACTWSSRKWSHTSKSGNLLLRLFYKSSLTNYASIEKMTEEELLQTALTDVEKALGIDAAPAISEITRWENSMPNYLIDHKETVTSLEQKLADIYPGIELAGCSYYGVSLPDCIENGEKTAKKVITELA
ncbi:protoporphyrinogen oxidase [Cytobacillus gottheilii]|uniref:protoporphyrinogen oxidase n=1 Tax=Cytobacillus gottheilii TaxID=859144 RepID=UPI0009B98059|nr:protoporphyrinogen oxidase [Cytobacillus gottheilii]